MTSPDRDRAVEGASAEDIDALSFDFVILGGGMAGMSAAGYASSRGATVCVIEKGAHIGGSAVLSSGVMWGAPTLEVLREHAPMGDARLQKAFIERFPAAVQWVRSTGVEVSGERDVLGFGKGHTIDILGYMARCEQLVRSAGGWVLRSTVADGLIRDRDRVRGVIARAKHGATTRIHAPAVVLATGGYQGDRSRLYEDFGENARQLLLRSNIHSTGDGLRLGVQAGGDLAGDPATFYGHLIAWPLLQFGPTDFQRLSLGHWSRVGLLINVQGDRFIDESFAHQANAIATARQPQARAALLFDERAFDVCVGSELHAPGPLSPSEREAARRDGSSDQWLESGRLRDVIGAGSRVAMEENFERLLGKLEAWGFDPHNTAATIEKYNAMLRGDPNLGTPPRRGNRHLFDRGPYVAFETRPGITATQGGLRVDDRSCVLGPTGEPIPGLFAAGTDAGDFYNGGYAGGLSVSCVFGLSAIETVLGPELFT